MLTTIKMLRQTSWNPVYIQICAKSNGPNIKNLNFDSKALFGAVKKRTPGDKESIANNNLNTVEDEPTSSEMYWLLEHKPEMSKIKKKISKSLKTTRKKSSKPTGSESESVTSDMKAGPESKPSKINKEKAEAPPLIPFDSKSLKTTRKKTSKSTGSENESVTSDLKTAPENKPSEINEEKAEDPPLIPFDSKGLKAILNFPIVPDGRSQSIITENTTYAGRTPSVGQILQATMSEGSRKALINWKLTKIAELGEKGFKELQQDHLTKGKLLHKALQDYLVSGSQPTIPPETTKLWESVSPVLESLKPKPELIEARVEHPFLKYRGVVDCVSTIGNTLSVIEWKKSDKLKTTIDATYDAPVQLCAYLGALSVDPRYKLEAQQGYVIVAYSDSKPAEVHYMNEIQLRKYWDIWLRKVQEFWIRTRDGTLPEPI